MEASPNGEGSSGAQQLPLEVLPPQTSFLLLFTCLIMSQVIEIEEVAQPAHFSSSSTSIGIGYVVIVLMPIVLKLLGLTRVATWPWQKVTVTIWGPCLLMGGISAIGWIVYAVQRRRD